MKKLFSGPKGLFCVYCLQSLNPQFKDTSYIGYTPTPLKRIRQHNKEITGGARRTSTKGPWRMGIFITGFPTHIAGLKFEYIWTYPTDSKYIGVLRSPTATPHNPHTFKSAMQILRMLLENEPYCNQPLTINFLHIDLYNQYQSFFKELNIKVINETDFITEKGFDVRGDEVYTCIQRKTENCKLCKHQLSKTFLSCTYCQSMACMSCFAKHLTVQGQTKPEQGSCFNCNNIVYWNKLLLNQQDYLVNERIQLKIQKMDDNSENSQDNVMDINEITNQFEEEQQNINDSSEQQQPLQPELTLKDLNLTPKNKLQEEISQKLEKAKEMQNLIDERNKKYGQKMFDFELLSSASQQDKRKLSPMVRNMMNDEPIDLD